MLPGVSGNYRVRTGQNRTPNRAQTTPDRTGVPTNKPNPAVSLAKVLLA